jgi:hypothetical protein
VSDLEQLNPTELRPHFVVPSINAFAVGVPSMLEEKEEKKAACIVRAPLGANALKFYDLFVKKCGLFSNALLDLSSSVSITAYTRAINLRVTNSEDAAGFVDRGSVSEWLKTGNDTIATIGAGDRKLIWRVLFGDAVIEHANSNSDHFFRSSLKTFKNQTLKGYEPTICFLHYLNHSWGLLGVMDSVAVNARTAIEHVSAIRRIQYAFIFVLQQERHVAAQIMQGFLSRMAFSSRVQARKR